MLLIALLFKIIMIKNLDLGAHQKSHKVQIVKNPKMLTPKNNLSEVIRVKKYFLITILWKEVSILRNLLEERRA